MTLPGAPLSLLQKEGGQRHITDPLPPSPPPPTSRPGQGAGPVLTPGSAPLDRKLLEGRTE